MKIFTAMLMMILLLQQAASTHLETCECEEIRAMVNATVEEAISRLESKFSGGGNSAALISTFEKLLKPIQTQLNYHLPPPPSPQEAFTQSNPAKSCKAIYTAYPNAKSDYYWIKPTSGSAVRVYCKLDANCTGYTGGWMWVAYIDMRNSSHQCPSGTSLLTRNSDPRRVCDRSSTSYTTCASNLFSVHGLSYSHVYGRIIAYQNDRPLAFYYRSYNRIDQAYVFGVSLTHGQSPRKHIWTFAGATDETSSNPTFKCPCINSNISPSLINIPSFIRNDYFCDTSLSTHYANYGRVFFPSDPLWDGKGCGSSNTCCSASNLCTNSPPWFIKHLSSSTTDSVELRLCRPNTDGSTPIEVVELYVQ